MLGREFSRPFSRPYSPECMEGVFSEVGELGLSVGAWTSRVWVPPAGGRQGAYRDARESTQERVIMDSSGSNFSDLKLSELQQYLGDTNFPADKQIGRAHV